MFIYLNPSASTFRYLFPGFIGFGLFVIFPLVYTVYIGFTKYSSQNLLRFDRSAALIRNETFLSPNAASYKYKLYAQEDGNYVLYLEDEKDAARRFQSEPFELTPGAKPKTAPEPVKLNALSTGRGGSGQAHGNGPDQQGQAVDPHESPPICPSRRNVGGLGGADKFFLAGAPLDS